MRMVSARFSGYRRFEKATTLDLTPRVLAIVGPNEAGKSSLLDALEMLTEPGPVEFEHRDFSGWERPADRVRVLSALFEVDEADKRAMANIPGASAVRLLELWRDSEGEQGGRALPRLQRDRGVRDRLAVDLDRLGQRRTRVIREFLERRADELESSGEEEVDSPEEAADLTTVGELLAISVADLRDEDEELSAEVRERLERLCTLLSSLPQGVAAYMQKLPDACHEVADQYQAKHPALRARAVLLGRCPQVRVLRDADRQLRTGYHFEEHDSPPAPLENLLSLAGVNWDDLKEAAAKAENPRLRNLLGRANRRLGERLHGSWRQSDVSVELSEQGGQLNVYPYDAASDEHTKIEERSDGFRSFLALLAFTSRHSEGERKLILGIDEAERHLHYDAQVDLVGVLTRETDFATQIIYTTHSAGCLPEDLGSAIRVVKQCDRDRSEVVNGFWTAQEDPKQAVAFTSLLMAMGASAVAFTPARRAVIGEGPSDALLLPALFRQALGVGPDHPLGLQVAGGLAWTPPRLLPRLEAEAAHVIYLTDSDKPGDEYRKALEAAGVPTTRLFRLSAGSVNGLSVEDFVDQDLYVEIVNLLLREIRDYDGPKLKKSALPGRGIAAATEKWTRDRGLAPLSKPAVAEHLLRLSGAGLAYRHWDPESERGQRPLLRAGRRASLLTLFERMRTALGIEAIDRKNGSGDAA